MFPTEILNPKYKNIPTDSPLWKRIDTRLRFIKIPCGRCLECRKKRANEWKQRLFEEQKAQHNPAYFITLTVSEETCKNFKIDYKNGTTVEEEHKMITQLISAWRKRNHKQGIKETHFFATEKGQESTERIHAHGIIWTNDPIEKLKENWTAGIFDIGKKGVSERSIPYIVKYIQKPDRKHDQFISKIYASKGIGEEFIKKHKEEYLQSGKDAYRTPKGYKISLCNYYKKKIFSDNEREQMRLKKQDEQKAYLDGIEYNLKNLQEYKQYVNVILQKQTMCATYYKPKKNKKKVFEDIERFSEICQKEQTYETERSIKNYLERTRGKTQTTLENDSRTMET